MENEMRCPFLGRRRERREKDIDYSLERGVQTGKRTALE